MNDDACGAGPAETLVSHVTMVTMQEHGYDCAMCGVYSTDRYAVPWYEEPVRSGASEGGYASVCKPCHDKWDAWDSSFSG